MRVRDVIAKRRIVWTCLAISFCCWLLGGLLDQKVRDFSHRVSVCSLEGGFDAEVVCTVSGESGEAIEGTAWRELQDEMVSAKRSGRTGLADVLMIYGDSRGVLPYAGRMTADDTEGCIIGVELAEDLFGGRLVQGQQLVYGGRLLTVRDVIQEPAKLLVCETDAPEKTPFAGISFFADDPAKKRRSDGDLIGRYGPRAEVVRFDLYENLKWLEELIPGQWSDFDGWRKNFTRKCREAEIVKRAEKNSIEIQSLQWIGWRNWCYAIGMAFSIAAVAAGCYRSDAPLLFRKIHAKLSV